MTSGRWDASLFLQNCELAQLSIPGPVKSSGQPVGFQLQKTGVPCQCCTLDSWGFLGPPAFFQYLGSSADVRQNILALPDSWCHTGSSEFQHICGLSQCHRRDMSCFSGHVLAVQCPGRCGSVVQYWKQVQPDPSHFSPFSLLHWIGDGNQHFPSLGSSFASECQVPWGSPQSDAPYQSCTQGSSESSDPISVCQFQQIDEPSQLSKQDLARSSGQQAWSPLP